MAAHAVEGLYGRQLTIDLCVACQGVWFDHGESLQLSPHGTLTLFRLLHERQATARQALADRLQCPRCTLRLSLTWDQQRETKFQYFRCPREHGRFITVFQFLRSRNFVRSLTPQEIGELRARIAQVHCSNCGAPIELAHHVACAYCRAPVSMLDPDQLQRTLAELREADARRQQPRPDLPLDLMMERLKAERVFAEVAAADPRGRPSLPGAGDGLVEAGVSLLLNLLNRS